MRVTGIMLMFLWLQTMQAQQQYRYRLDFTVGSRDFVDTVQIEYERGQVYVPVTIDGQQLRFKLDTGSSQGVVYDDTPLKGMRPIGHIRSEDATGASRPVTMVELPMMSIGDLTLRGYKAALHQRQVKRRGEDGIIGFDLLRKMAAKIDVRHQRMILTDRKKMLKGEQGFSLPYKLVNYTPRVQIEPVESEEATVVIDTGSRELLSLNRSWTAACLAGNEEARAQVEGRCIGQMAIGHFGVEPEAEVVFLGLHAVRWGDLQLRDVHCITSHGNSHIGAPLLTHGTLTVNPFQRRLVFQPYDEQMELTDGGKALSYCQIGNEQRRIAFVPKQGRAVVGLIWERSDAYRQGFRQGDIIEQIDGCDVSFDDFLRFRAVYDQQYQFTLRDRHGMQRTLRAEMPTLKRPK